MKKIFICSKEQTTGAKILKREIRARGQKN